MQVVQVCLRHQPLATSMSIGAETVCSTWKALDNGSNLFPTDVLYAELCGACADPGIHKEDHLGGEWM